MFSFARNGKETEKLLEKERFDVIFLDGRLGYGKMTGLDLLLKWKSDGRELLPVFMISGDLVLRPEGIKAGPSW